MELEGNSNSDLGCLPDATEGKASRAAIWDNAPAHRGEAVREWTPELERGGEPAGLQPGLQRRWAVWGWAREEVTACAWAAGRRCKPGRAVQPERRGETARTVLQSRAETLPRDSRPDSQHPANAHPTLALV